MNKIYKKNINLCKKKYPRFAEWVESAEDLDWVEPIRSKDGSDNLLITTNGKIEPLYDRDNPRKKAKEFLKDKKFGGNDLNIIVGFGLGYLTQTIIKKMDVGHTVVVFEPNPYFVKRAFELYDYSEYIEKSKLIITTGERNEASHIINELMKQKTLECKYITLTDYGKVRKDYLEIATLAGEVIKQLECNSLTITNAGAILADNDIINIPYLLQRRGIKELENLYTDEPEKREHVGDSMVGVPHTHHPAVIVSAGPSLRKNIHLLKDKQKNIIIIATGQTLRPLLAYDITPDFICSVDYGDINMCHYEGLLDQQVPMITLNKSYPPLIKKYRGPMFVVSSTPEIGNTASDILAEKGFIETGGSVAHLCFGVAKHFGCNPITFIGQDLAIGKESHFSQIDDGGSIQVNEDGIVLMNVNSPRNRLHDKICNAGSRLFVQGYFGDDVMTTHPLATFLTSFENMIEFSPDHTIFNSTQGGAKIKGAEGIFLKDFLEHYCDEEIDKSVINEYLSLVDNKDELVEKSISVLKEDIKSLNKIIKYSKEGLSFNKEARKILKTKRILTKKKEKKELQNTLNENTKVTYNVEMLSRMHQTMATNLYRAERIARSKKYYPQQEIHLSSIKNNEKEFKKQLRKGLKRNEIILDAAKISAKRLIEEYEKSVKVLKEYDKTKDESILNPREGNEPANLDDVDKYFATGNFSHPMLEAKRYLKENKDLLVDEKKKVKNIIRKAKRMRDKLIKEVIEESKDDSYNKLMKYNNWMDAAKESCEQGHYEGGIQELKFANELFPDREEALWGLAENYWKTEEYEKSLDAYNKLIKNFPENALYQFQRSLVLASSGKEFEGINALLKVFEKTSVYNKFLFQIGKTYEKYNMVEEAVKVYEWYLEEFSADYFGWERLSVCYKKLGIDKEAERCYAEFRNIKPEKGKENERN